MRRNFGDFGPRAFYRGLRKAKIDGDAAPERTARLSASPRLFENRFLDFFSRIHPSVPAIIFVPVVVGGMWLGQTAATGARVIGAVSRPAS